MRLQQLPLFVQIIVLLISTLVTASVEATTVSRDYAVIVSAEIQKSPAQIRLVWLADPDATGYQVYRKSRDAIAWGSPTTLPRSATSYTDNSVSVGTRYEYRISKTARELLTNTYYTGHSYVYSGIEVPATEQRGKLILVVDNTHSAALATELARLQQDLVGDGWQVLRRDVARTASVASVKSVIVAAYNTDPANVEAVLLFGNVPVPYSGYTAFDGHQGPKFGNHQGAWPADVFYGEMNGTWTDNSVNITDSRLDANDNIPGDLKYDQSFLPSDVDLQVGRVDLAKMSAFPKSERELLRQYLNKDHNFRHRLISVRARGLIDDPLGVYPGDIFAAGGWRNFTTFFGATGIDEGPKFNPNIDFFPTLGGANSYLWAQGAGAGSFTSALGIGETAPGISYNAPGIPFPSTHNFVITDTKAVFYMLWGSFLGDWNTENNFLRAPLATATYGLTSAYAGRPHWFFHHMALGETIGYSTRLTQNNSTLYTSHGHIYTRGIHNALMGDPTLRMHIVAPPANFTSRVTATGVSLDWDAAPDAVRGYHIYRAATAAGPFTRLNNALVTGTAFFDNDTTPGNDTYMVRAVALESSASGSYFNLSQGMFSTAAGIPTSGLPAGLLQFSSPRYLVSEATTAGMAVITVTRSGGDNGAVSVQYATSDGTASAGADYTAVSGTLTFPNGDTNATFSIPYDNDTLVELDETVNISLSAPTGGATLDALNSAELTIINDDELLQFDAASYSVNENEGTATITVIRTGMDTGPVEVSYSTGNGAALAGEDYTTRSGTLSFADGVTSRSFTVPIINDTEIEGDERINLTLSDPSGFSTGLGAASSATLLIIDDD